MNELIARNAETSIGQISVGDKPLSLCGANSLRRLVNRTKGGAFSGYLNQIGQIPTSGRFGKADAVFGERRATSEAHLHT